MVNVLEGSEASEQCWELGEALLECILGSRGMLSVIGCICYKLSQGFLRHGS